jgi:DMSO/TMAO reductase YedYZ molybdopterin-dependent catalytic subunit
MSRILTRRKLLTTGMATAGATMLGGCGRLFEGDTMRPLLDFGQLLSYNAHRLLLAHQPLVREYSMDDISPDFPSNGTAMPSGSAYFDFITTNFENWRLKVDGLVKNPLSVSLDEIKAMPSRSQITQHSCDEGWTAIGQWTGVPLAHLLNMAELQPEARYIVFHCLDEMTSGELYYESIDLFAAFHPQTILAYGMNGGGLPIRHGAPLRLRVEYQVGYKNAKFVTRVEAVDRLNMFGRGKGGYWPDRGYQWYAGL